jgi:hypothetical protein
MTKQTLKESLVAFLIAFVVVFAGLMTQGCGRIRPRWTGVLEDVFYAERHDFTYPSEYGTISISIVYEDESHLDGWSDDSVGRMIVLAISRYVSMGNYDPSSNLVWTIYILPSGTLWEQVCYSNNYSGCSGLDGDLFPTVQSTLENQIGLRGEDFAMSDYLHCEIPETMCHEAMHILYHRDVGEYDANHLNMELWDSWCDPVARYDGEGDDDWETCESYR